MPKETSAQVSTLAADYINFTATKLAEKLGGSLIEGPDAFCDTIITLAYAIRTLAASALSQDETSGQD